jgi:hypothetical protein
VDFEDALTLVGIGQTGADFKIETARTEKGLVDHVLAVGGADDQKVAIFVEAVHLCE